MRRTVFMAEMSWIEYRERMATEGAVLLLPVGALEQHGPHLPLGTDAILATEMARRAAERLDGVVAPTLTYGYKSSHAPAAATTSAAQLAWMAEPWRRPSTISSANSPATAPGELP
jgi:creatinine amidohydrolase/Fe(II)-dependent formamide hydrolase-like protein